MEGLEQSPWMTLVQAGILLAGVVVGALAYVKNLTDRRRAAAADVVSDPNFAIMIKGQKDICLELLKIVDEIRHFRRLVEAFLQTIYEQRSAPDKYVNVLTEIRDGLGALNRRQTEEMERMHRLLADLGDRMVVQEGRESSARRR